MRAEEVAASVTLFSAIAATHSAATEVGSRSADDKEYASEDWLAAAARWPGVAVEKQPRHSAFDFAASVDHANGPVVLALQTKGLKKADKGGVRNTLDYNSTLPEPRHGQHACLLVYTELAQAGVGNRATSVVVADMTLVQEDPTAAQSGSVDGHGSFGDVKARFRLMYVGAQPVALAAQQGLDLAGRAALILPAGALHPAAAVRAGLGLAGTLVRSYASRRLVSAHVFLDGRDPEPQWEPVPPRPDRLFEVWVPTRAPDGALLMVPAQRRPSVPEELALEWS